MNTNHVLPRRLFFATLTLGTCLTAALSGQAPTEAPRQAVTEVVANWEYPASRTRQALDAHLLAYDVLRVDLPAAERAVRGAEHFRLTLADRSFELSLEPVDVRAPDHRAFITTDAGVTEQEDPGIFTYKGHVYGDDSSEVRLLVLPDLLQGYIRTRDDWIFVDPLLKFDKNADRSLVVVYRDEDVAPTNPGTCGSEGLALDGPGAAESLKASGGASPFDLEGAPGNALRNAELATDADYEYSQIYGSNTNRQILGVVNQVNGIYSRELGVRFFVTFQHVYRNPRQPYTSTNPSGLLSQFRDEWNSGRTRVVRDVAHLFTGKDLDDNVVGTAYSAADPATGATTGTVCNARDAYGLSRDVSQLAKLVAHEIGHNFGAEHSGGRCGDGGAIMCRAIGTVNPRQFTLSSVTAIRDFIDTSGSCLGTDEVGGEAGKAIAGIAPAGLSPITPPGQALPKNSSTVFCGGEGEAPCGVFDLPFIANGTGFCDSSLVATGFNVLPDIPAARANDWLSFNDVTLQQFRGLKTDAQNIRESFQNIDYSVSVSVEFVCLLRLFGGCAFGVPKPSIESDIFEIFGALGGIGDLFETLGNGLGDIVVPTVDGKVVTIPIPRPQNLVPNIDFIDPEDFLDNVSGLTSLVQSAADLAVAYLDEVISIVTGLIEDFDDPPGVCLDLDHRRHNWNAELHLDSDGVPLRGPFGELLRGVDGGDMSDFRQSWAYWALSAQRDLGQKEPLNWIQHLDTHNAFNNASDGFVIPNQRYSLTGQLELGVRSLELDPNDVFGISPVRTCHSKPEKLDVGCSLLDRLFDNSLKEIRNWLDHNPNEVIILRLENYVADETLEELLELRMGDVIYRQGDDGFFFHPSQPWPSIAEIRSLDRQVVVLGYHDPGASQLWWPYPAVEQSGTAFNAEDDGGNPNPQWICRSDFRLTDDPFRDFGAMYEFVTEEKSLDLIGAGIYSFVDGDIRYSRDGENLSVRDQEFSAYHAFTRLTESRPLLESILSEPGELEHFLNEPDVAQLARCRVALLSMDFLHAKDETSKDGCEASGATLPECRSYQDSKGNRVNGDHRLSRAVWSWAESDFGQFGDGGKLETTGGRWHSAPIDERNHVACARPREGDPRSWVDPDGADWRVTAGTYTWRQSGQACISEFPGESGKDFVFGVPRIGWQNERLLEAAAAAGVTGGIWLNVNDIAVEGEFVINERPVARGAADPRQPQPHREAGPILFTSAGSFDPEGQALSYGWSFGDDGSGVDPTSTGPAPSHRYGDDTDFEVILNVDDGFGGVDISRFIVPVVNVRPEVGIDHVADETGAEIGVDVAAALMGLTVELAGSFSDVGWQDTHRATTHWGDGSGDGPRATSGNVVTVGSDVSGSTAFEHVFSTPATYTMTLTVEDDDGGSDSSARDVLIVDAAGAIELVLQQLDSTPGADETLRRLGNALDKIAKRNLNAGLEMILKSIEEIEALEAGDTSLDLHFAKSFLSLAAKSEVVAAIATAEARASTSQDLQKIRKARDLTAQGDALLAQPAYAAAAGAYLEAIRQLLGSGSDPVSS